MPPSSGWSPTAWSTGSGSTTSTAWPTRPPTCGGWPPRCRSWSSRRSSRTASACPPGRSPAPPATSSWPSPTGCWSTGRPPGPSPGATTSSPATTLTRAVALACKRERLARDFGSEVAGVARHLPGDQAANRAAVAELAARLPVYRTYVTDVISGTDRQVVAEAAAAARPALAAAGVAALDRLVAALTLAVPAPQVVRRFQQLSGPAMAKGEEDTALYRDTRLVARNEVGGNLAVFGRPVAELHQANTEREARWPQSMLATSTHDTKRGEDVRARLAVLSERPARWWPLATSWTERLGHGVA